MGKKKKQMHYSPAELKEMMKRVSNETLIAPRTAWTCAMYFMAHPTMKVTGFKGKRLTQIAERVYQLNVDFEDGKFTTDDLCKMLVDKIGWYPWTDPDKVEDIPDKKGSIGYYLDYVQIPARNTINTYATIYSAMWTLALIERADVSKKQIEQIWKEYYKFAGVYKGDKSIFNDIAKDLADDANIGFEPPKHPYTNKYVPSVLMGAYA